MSAQLAMSFPELTALTDEPAATLAMEEALSGMMDSRTLSHIMRAFEQMEMVEEELATYSKRFPEAEDQLQKTFCALRWMLSTPVSDPVYRHHVAELLQRVVDGESLDLGTRAEALMAFSATSLKAPLTSEATIVALTLFEDIHGEVRNVTDHDLREPWPGAGDELLSGLLRKLSQKRFQSH